MKTHTTISFSALITNLFNPFFFCYYNLIPSKLYRTEAAMGQPAPLLLLFSLFLTTCIFIPQDLDWECPKIYLFSSVLTL